MTRDRDTTPRPAAPLPSMDKDNTATGSAMSESVANQVINQIRAGMRVVDAAGEELGKVDDVKMGNPGAADAGSRLATEPGLIAEFLGADRAPAVPEPFHSRLLRFGYVKIDGKGWIDTDRFVTADQIAAVEGDTVHLAADKDAILADSW